MLVYINDADPYTVIFEEAEGGTLVRGLPLMRPGKYHGIQYDAEAFQGIADNFAVIRDGDSFVPALLPHHQYDHDGNMVPMDASDIQGYFEAVTFDEESDALRGDVLISDADVVQAIKDKKLRYMSTEIDGDYQLAADDQKGIGPALVGVAWVTYPASRGMPISTVANAADFPVYIHSLGAFSSSQLTDQLTKLLGEQKQYTSDDDYVYIRELYEDYVIVEASGEFWRHTCNVDGDEITVDTEREEVKQNWVIAAAQKVQSHSQLQAHLNKKGGTSMSETLKIRIQAALDAVKAGNEPADDLAALVAQLPDADQVEPAADDSSIKAQLEQLTRGNEEMRAQVQAQAMEHRKESVNVQLDALVMAGVVPPALRSQTYVILDILMRDGNQITVLGEADPTTGKPTEKKHAAKDVFVDILRQVSAGISTGPVGLVYQGEMVLPSSVDDADEVKAGDEMAARMRKQSGLPAE